MIRSNISKAFLACCLLLTVVHGAANPIPIEVVPWEGVKERLDKSDVVVIGMLDSLNAVNENADTAGPSKAADKLHQQLRMVRELGDQAIPGLDDKTSYSDKISILIAETNPDGEEGGIELHQQKVKSLYEMADARPYVISNPVILLISKGKLVRAYGPYHEPGTDGILIRQLASTLLSPEIREQTLLPEIVMMETLDLRAEQGNDAAIAHLTEQYTKFFGTRESRRAYSYFWTEAQVRSGAVNALWASQIYDMLFTTCLRNGEFRLGMQVIANLCSNLRACGRYGRLAEVMAVWEQGHKTAGNRMDISSYPDRGAAMDGVPMIRHRDMPVTRPSQVPVPAGSNASGFHVNDAAAFADYAALHYSAGRWQEALEYNVWIRDWATDDKSGQPIGEYATMWYAVTHNFISTLDFMGFREEALALLEEGMAAPHGQTYHGRWKIILAAEQLHSLMRADRAPADLVQQLEGLTAKATGNSHISLGTLWSIQTKLAEALIKNGRIPEGEAILDQLAARGSSDARRSQLTHWVKTGRIANVEEEFKNLLRYSRENGQKMDEYVLYRDYADFLEQTGRFRDALILRREVIRLAKAFRIFTHLPLEHSKLALLLRRLGDSSEAAKQALIAMDFLDQEGLPGSIAAQVRANLQEFTKMAGETIADPHEAPDVDLQPQMSVVIPVADLPWTTYLTLTNPGDGAQTGQLEIRGQAVESFVNEESGDITLTLMPAADDPAPTRIPCTLAPGTYRLIQLHGNAESATEGQLQFHWQDADSTAEATVKLEAPEAGVAGAIIQAGAYRANPFYGVPMFLQYATKETGTDSPPLRFVCSHASRVEIYQIDGTPLAIDAHGDGSLLGRGDELFVKSDGLGNLILPLANGRATMNLLLYPEKGIPSEGLTLDVEAFIDGKWQLFSRNRLAP